MNGRWISWIDWFFICFPNRVLFGFWKQKQQLGNWSLAPFTLEALEKRNIFDTKMSCFPGLWWEDFGFTDVFLFESVSPMLCLLVIMAAYTSRAIVLQNNDLINKKSGLKVEGSNNWKEFQ